MSTPESYGQAPAQQPGAYAEPNSGLMPTQPGYAGQHPQQFAVMAPYGPAPQNGVGTGGFVTGLLGLVFFWAPGIGVILAIIGVSLSGVGIAKAKRGEATNKGLAIAGLTCGIVALAIWLILLMAAVSVLP